MIKLTLSLGWLAICNALLAVMMPWYVVTRLGVGVETDAFFASGILPQLAFYMIGAALLQVLVPLLVTKTEQDLSRDAWTFFVGVAGLFVLIGLVLVATASYWAPLLVPGFSPKGKELMITMTRLQLVSMVFIVAISVLWSVYQARQKFIWIELSLVIANVISLLLLVFALPRYGIVSAAWTGVLNNGLRLALLLPVLGRWQRPNWRTPMFSEVWRRIKPFVLGQGFTRSDLLVDRFLSSMASAGALSLLLIGQQIYLQINLVINKAISAPMLPLLALTANNSWFRFRRLYRHRLLIVVALTSAGVLLLYFSGEPLLRLTIGHGGITVENVRALWLVMMALAGMLAGGAAGQITSTAFYAMGDTKTPTRLFILTYTIYLPLKVLAFLRYGVMGLALATSLHLIVNFALQLIVLERATAPTRAPGIGLHSFNEREELKV